MIFQGLFHGVKNQVQKKVFYIITLKINALYNF